MFRVCFLFNIISIRLGKGDLNIKISKIAGTSWIRWASDLVPSSDHGRSRVDGSLVFRAVCGAGSPQPEGHTTKMASSLAISSAKTEIYKKRGWESAIEKIGDRVTGQGERAKTVIPFPLFFILDFPFYLLFSFYSYPYFLLSLFYIN